MSAKAESLRGHHAWFSGVLAAPRPHPWAIPIAVSALIATAGLGWHFARTSTERLDAYVSPARPTPFGEVWIGTRLTAQNLAGLDEATTRVFLGGSTSFALGGWGASVPSLAWASEASFADDLAAGRIPSDVRVVMYDPENWSATPADERLHPGAAMRAFGRLARRHGYLVVITPHPNLVRVAGAECIPERGEALESAFLRCGIEADAARYADAVEVQAQYLEADVPSYRDFVAEAAAQAREANPGVLVLSGLSTTFAQEPSVLFNAWRSVVGVVDGHYLNVPHGRRPHVALAFLQMAAAAV